MMAGEMDTLVPSYWVSAQPGLDSIETWLLPLLAPQIAYVVLGFHDLAGAAQGPFSNKIMMLLIFVGPGHIVVCHGEELVWRV